MNEQETLGALLRNRADRRGDAPFLIFEDRTISYADFHAMTLAVAKALVAQGVAPGEHVAILMPNCPEAAALFYGAHLAGVVAVPVNARFKRRELRHVAAHSDARILFTTSTVREHVDFVGLVWDSIDGLAEAPSGTDLALAAAPRLKAVVVIGDAPAPALRFDDFLAFGRDIAIADIDARTDAVSPEDTAYLLYTSGTTAAPKGCELTHRAVIRAWGGYAGVAGVKDGEAIWSPCPFFHIGGIGLMAAALLHHGRFLSMAHFDGGAALEMIARHRPAHLFPAFPPLTLGTLRAPDYRPESWDFVRTALNVSPPDTQRMIQALLPPHVRLLNDFGMTEGSGIITMTGPADDDDRRLASNGRPLPGIEIRIVDPATMTPLAGGLEGEIQFRGVNAFRRYYRDPAATAAAVDADGWVATGDLGRIDEGGCLHFIGRLKDILKVGGENVAPAEIEAHLSTHPAVKMVQVVGRADDKYGEVAVAFVEPMPGYAADAESLIGFCVGHLASFKVPREVRFVTDWPMSATKIQKFKLRELL